MNEDKVQGNPLNPAALDALSKDLESLKQVRDGNRHERVAPSASTAKAAVDFISALAVCSLIGFGIDYVAHTSPIGLFVGLLGGTAIGAKLMITGMNREDKN